MLAVAKGHTSAPYGRKGSGNGNYLIRARIPARVGACAPLRGALLRRCAALNFGEGGDQWGRDPAGESSPDRPDTGRPNGRRDAAIYHHAAK